MNIDRLVAYPRYEIKRYHSQCRQIGILSWAARPEGRSGQRLSEVASHQQTKRVACIVLLAPEAALYRQLASGVHAARNPPYCPTAKACLATATCCPGN
jgi:hypothetical protein